VDFSQSLLGGFSVLLWQLKLMVWSPKPRLVGAYFLLSLQFLKYPGNSLSFEQLGESHRRVADQAMGKCPAQLPSASGFCTCDGFDVEQCLKVW